MVRQSRPSAPPAAAPSAATTPVPPPAPAGYSGTPLHRKLGIKPGHRVLVIGAPTGVPAAPLDADGAAEVVRVSEPTRAAPSGPPSHGEPLNDVILAFCPDAASMADRLPAAMAATADHGRCWVAWPKKASKVVTDLTEDVVREAALRVGWVDVKVCAVDGTWSGLCLMRRVTPPGPLLQVARVTRRVGSGRRHGGKGPHPARTRHLTWSFRTFAGNLATLRVRPP